LKVRDEGRRRARRGETTVGEKNNKRQATYVRVIVVSEP
jgi:hypothetical protein